MKMPQLSQPAPAGLVTNTLDAGGVGQAVVWRAPAGAAGAAGAAGCSGRAAAAAMVRCGFYPLLQTVVCGALVVGALMPYVQYLMFSQALSAGPAPPAASASPHVPS